MLVTSLFDEKLPIFDRLSGFANTSFGKNLHSRLVIINVIHIIIALPNKRNELIET